MSTSKIAVAGATGRLGSHVVDVLTERGHQVVPMSRATGVDIITGDGLADALTGTDAIIDVASWHASDQQAATQEIIAEAAGLLGARRGIKVVGVDNPDLPDAEYAANGGYLPSAHAKLAGPSFAEWSGFTDAEFGSGNDLRRL